MLETVNAFIWGNLLLSLLLGTGLYYTVRMRGFQLRGMGRVLRCTFSGCRSRTAGSGRISQLQTMSAALAATMGTGNIVGVATALTLGGPGAIFWMWISAILGMLLVYAENMLGALFRYRCEDGSWCGGALAYLERGMRSRPLALAFAGCCVLASLGMGNLAQVNSLACAARDGFGVPPVVCGLVTAALAGIIILGGVDRIGKAAQSLILPLSGLYLLCGVVFLILRRDALGDAFSSIFRGAFGLTAVGGGVSGAAVRQCINIGLRRGVFSNEAGLGSASLLHAAGEAEDPCVQGMCGIFEVFADTILCCTMTALVILCSGVTDPTLEGAALVMAAFSARFGAFGRIFITLSVMLFAFATLIGWSVCGESAARYLSPRWGSCVYRICFLFACMIGAVQDLTLVWQLSDLFNGLMAFPNLIGLIGLRRHVHPPA